MTPDRVRKEVPGQAWADVEIPEFPGGGEALEYPGCQVLGELKGGDYIQDDSQVTNQDPRETEGMRELMKGSPLEQAAQSVLRQLGTSSSDGNWGEVIRSVELPPLQDLREGDLGSLILGDWIQLITPNEGPERHELEVVGGSVEPGHGSL